jgi:TolB-like protein
VTVVLVLLVGNGRVTASDGAPVAAVAVFPVENLTDGSIPADVIGGFLAARLAAEGVAVLDDAALEAFLARHRVRYAAGIDEITAESLRRETGVDSVVFASVAFSSAMVPPKISIVARLVSIEATPAVVWAEDAGLSGDDAPGWFDLGLVNEYDTLLDRALEGIGDSLGTFLRTGRPRQRRTWASKFSPKSAFRALTLEPGRTYSVAVVPFFNLTQRRRAGEIMALHFIRHLSDFAPFRVLDIGVARRQLLSARIIMDGGLSVSDAETVAALIDADFVLAGRVLRYDDYEGPQGLTGVEFSTVLIARQSRRVVWSSHSYNEGQDGVRFFGRGESKTAHAMATQMVGLTAQAMAGRDAATSDGR